MQPWLFDSLRRSLRRLDAQEVGNIDYWISKYVEPLITLEFTVSELSSDVEAEE